MNPEHAKVILDMYCKDAAGESVTTRKVIAAIPDGQGGYSPHEKSMNALDLAWHIASSEVWFLDSILNGAFGHGDGSRPESLTTAAHVAEWYDANFKPKLEQVGALDGDKAAAPIDFFGMMQLPAAYYLGFLLRHSAHHRGQLSAYLRPMGGKVPSIYGGSADEPMNM
ncbi:MAG: DinB family protein [Bryobacteraceae bacterium]|nr:DinB family protein [Bryobacteraceae bacterium]